jgi:hypothetical protein
LALGVPVEHATIPDRFGDVPVKPQLQKSLDSFAATWLENVREQGFVEAARKLHQEAREQTKAETLPPQPTESANNNPERREETMQAKDRVGLVAGALLGAAAVAHKISPDRLSSWQSFVQASAEAGTPSAPEEVNPQAPEAEARPDESTPVQEAEARAIPDARQEESAGALLAGLALGVPAVAAAVRKKEEPFQEAAPNESKGPEPAIQDQATESKTQAAPEATAASQQTATQPITPSPKEQSMTEHDQSDQSTTNHRAGGDRATSKPIKVESGAVRAFVFDNGPERGPTVTFKRIYKDQESGQWRLADGFREKHFDDLREAISKVEHVLEQRANREAAQQLKATNKNQDQERER